MLSKHFSREEFACKCGCGFDTVDVALLALLERVREWAKAPVTITSAARCATHNAAVGGKPNSQHVLGRAADIQVKGKTPMEVAEMVDAWYPETYGIGEYATFTHVDSRRAHARWRL